jgi:hypothetical protein
VGHVRPTVETVEASVDEAVRERLHDAIAAAGKDEEQKQLDGVLRMLAEKASADLLHR